MFDEERVVGDDAEVGVAFVDPAFDLPGIQAGNGVQVGKGLALDLGNANADDQGQNEWDDEQQANAYHVQLRQVEAFCGWGFPGRGLSRRCLSGRIHGGGLNGIG